MFDLVPFVARQLGKIVEDKLRLQEWSLGLMIIINYNVYNCKQIHFNFYINRILLLKLNTEHSNFFVESLLLADLPRRAIQVVINSEWKKRSCEQKMWATLMYLLRPFSW